MNSIFQIEEVINQLFDEVCPLIGAETRALKPLLASTLGQLMPDHNVRRLVSDREYYRVDLADFADYATSTLPPNPILGHYPDNRALLYEGVDRRPEEPLITTKWSGRDFGLSILDAVVARYKAFVSVTMRLLVYRDARATYGQQYGNLDPDDVAGATVLTTIVFAAKPVSAIASLDDPVLDKQPLEEWDRYYVLLPVPSDLEWRFVLSGTYTDFFLEQSLKNPGRPGGLAPDQIRRVREGRQENETEYAVEFELARLALALPSYVSFMYDLVENENVPVRQPNHPNNHKIVLTLPGDSGSLKHRVIRSVRVVRPDSGAKWKSRSWSPASHVYAVRGHWRALSDSDRQGRDQYGNPVRGKTWVSDYEKGYGDVYPFPTSSKRRSSSVVINIKEPLSYGRDVIQSFKKTPASQLGHERRQHTRESVAKTESDAPSREWRARERAKLTAGLRYSVLRRDGFRCRQCGRSAADENGLRLEVDHRISIDQWGRTEEANLWTLCLDCNRGKVAHPI